jgi:hypothetical protein
MFAVSIESIDGRSVVTTGHMSELSFVVQIGERLVRVWLGKTAPDGPSEPTPIMEVDARSLKSGILLESSWTHAVVHDVTEEELAAGAAMIYVPGDRHSAVVEVRFRPLETATPPPGTGRAKQPEPYPPVDSSRFKKSRPAIRCVAGGRHT